MTNEDQDGVVDGLAPADEDFVSKSQVKRDMLALQKTAERLLQLKPSQWETLGFSPVVMDALEESSRIKSHIAKRRHLRRIAKLLSKEDTEQLDLLLQDIDQQHHRHNERFHRIEQWRDRLLEEGDDALQQLLDECPKADRQRLRQLIRNAKKELENQKPPTSKRKLFQYIKELY